MLRRHKVIAALSGVAVAVLGLSVSYLLSIQEDPRQAFLRDLERKPLLYSDGISGGGLSPEAAKLALPDVKETGIELLAAYKDNPNNPVLRLNLAYLLLLDENSEYLEYVRAVDSNVPSIELWLWHFIAPSDKLFSSVYKSMFYDIVAKSDSPCATLILAQKHRREEKTEEAVRGFLEVQSCQTPWAHTAQMQMRKIRKQLRVELCLKYLESETVLGAHAAYYVAEAPEYRSKAIDYLRLLLDSESLSAVAAAARNLYGICEAASYQKEYERFMQSPTDENRKKLENKIRASEPLPFKNEFEGYCDSATRQNLNKLVEKLRLYTDGQLDSDSRRTRQERKRGKPPTE